MGITFKDLEAINYAREQLKAMMNTRETLLVSICQMYGKNLKKGRSND